VVVIELEDGDDPQIIFETLNARGQPLLPSDLIRNYLFLQVANDPSSNADDLYNRYWRSFDETRVETAISGEDRFWHIEERQGRPHKTTYRPVPIPLLGHADRARPQHWSAV
jgi:hypothetical protein